MPTCSVHPNAFLRNYRNSLSIELKIDLNNVNPVPVSIPEFYSYPVKHTLVMTNQ